MNISTILADKEIRDEIIAKIKAGASNPSFPILDKELAVSNIERISKGETLPYDASLEAIILPTGRPPLIIQNSTFSIPTSEIWKERLQTAQNLLENVILSVGRIEVKNHDNKAWIGTGWHVADGIFATNRHVALEFAQKKANGDIKFLVNARHREIKPRVDLREEYRQPDEKEFEVTRVLHIEEAPGPDLAFLEVKHLETNALDIISIF